MGIFDTHAHYFDEKFKNTPEGIDGTLQGVLSSCACIEQNGKEYSFKVEHILNASVSIKDSEDSLLLADKYPEVYAGVGIHPHECEDISKEMTLDMAMAEIERLSRHEKAVAIGEIGLDYHYDFSDRAIQAEYFDAQMRLARKLQLPVIIHDREAHGKTLEILKANKGVIGVMHSYSGSAEMARELEALGYYISFSGSVTFKTAENLRAAARVVSDDRLLIETDAPYLSPVPLRGKLNRSDYTIHTAKVLADVRGCDVETIISLSESNAKRLFNIS